MKKITFEQIVSGEFARSGKTWGDRIAPHIHCTDGAVLSVQASSLHYCSPRDDHGPYQSVEVGYPTSPPPPSWDRYQDGENPVWGFVPVNLVRQFIEDHGGESDQG